MAKRLAASPRKRLKLGQTMKRDCLNVSVPEVDSINIARIMHYIFIFYASMKVYMYVYYMREPKFPYFISSHHLPYKLFRLQIEWYFAINFNLFRKLFSRTVIHPVDPYIDTRQFNVDGCIYSVSHGCEEWLVMFISIALCVLKT